jgi:hypothetical protein
MSIMFNPDATIGEQLENFIINFYEPEGREYLGDLLTEEECQGHKRELDIVADMFWDAGESLAGVDLTTIGQAVQSLVAMSSTSGQAFNFIQYVRVKSDLSLAQNIASLATRAAKRIESLRAMARQTRLSEATAAFLRLVSRCYLYGLDVECAILCRSALDTEFQAEIPTDECLRHLQGTGGGGRARPVDFSDRIATAKAMGRLDSGTAELAHQLRKETNVLVHRNPRPPRDIDALVQDTLTVIVALQRRPTGGTT